MHGDEYRAWEEGLQPGLTVGEPEADRGFDIAVERGLAYLTGLDLGSAFEKKARRNGGREW